MESSRQRQNTAAGPADTTAGRQEADKDWAGNGFEDSEDLLPTYEIELSEAAYRAVEDLAQKRGGSPAEVIRDAIALAKWFQDIRDEHARVLVERNGTVREVVQQR